MILYYHADRTRRLRPGQIVDLAHGRDSVNPDNAIAKHYLEHYPDGVTQHGYEYLLRPNRTTPHKDDLGMIEILAETIRQAHYPHRPSRYQSFFAAKTLQDAERFLQIISWESDVDIWKIECNDVVFTSDMKLLTLGANWLSASLNLHNYWQGRYSDDPFEEVLLKPPIKIIEKVSGLTID